MNSETILKRKEIIRRFIERRILVTKDFLDFLSSAPETEKKLQELLNAVGKDKKNPLVLSADAQQLLEQETLPSLNWEEFEGARAAWEKGKNLQIYQHFLSFIHAQENEKAAFSSSPVKILFSYDKPSKKREIQDFVLYFNARYSALEKMLRGRIELRNILSISRIIKKRERENVSLIGMVKEKETTKNNNIVLTLEDPSGSIKVLVNKNKPDMYKPAKDIVLDEVIGVNGVNGSNIVFANNILWPDVPLNERKKSKDEAYALFLSDLHVGSNNFLMDDFKKFIKWIQGDFGNEQQKNIAKKVKYIFIAGDLVDGCGIYPGQEPELQIPDIYEQYKACSELLRQIPPHIPLIICPGNHDAMRIAEPQPPLYKDFAGSIYELPNAYMVSNPALVNIHSSASFPGFDVLTYHGYSFDYFVSNVDGIRNGGGYDRADLIMKFLLQRRHLAPTHTSSLYLPETENDPMVIEKVPDFFISGHIHKTSVSNYRHITLISGSCWQSKTKFQEKVGHHPEPGRVPVVNLKTREVKILRFGK